RVLPARPGICRHRHSDSAIQDPLRYRRRRYYRDLGGCRRDFGLRQRLAIVVPLAFAGIAVAVAREAQEVAIARMNIANCAGAILGGGLIGGAASAGHLRWAFAIPLVLVPLIFLAARSFSSADHTWA